MKNKKFKYGLPLGSRSKARKFANIKIESRILKSKKLVDKIAVISDFKGSVDVIAIDGTLDFFSDVVDWFKQKHLQKGRHTPFVGNVNRIKDMLERTPDKQEGIFKGIYDEQTDEITDMAVVVADELDAKTKEVLGNEPLVILS